MESSQVGMVLGTESSTPLEWWVAIEPEQFLQRLEIQPFAIDVKRRQDEAP